MGVGGVGSCVASMTYWLASGAWFDGGLGGQSWHLGVHPCGFMHRDSAFCDGHRARIVAMMSFFLGGWGVKAAKLDPQPR
eukprot:6479664-Alexandrium_andersonii.AAC.1